MRAIFAKYFPRRILWRLFWGGLFCALLTHACELVILPQMMESLSRLFYRAVFFVSLPVWIVSKIIMFDIETKGAPIPNGFVAFLVPLAWYCAWVVYSFVSELELQSADKRINRVPGTLTPLSRRDFLGRVSVGVCGGVGAYATGLEPSRILVRRYTLPIRDLPEQFDGLRLVQISDTHYGPFMSLSFIRSAIALANNLEPDVVLLTGDYLHRSFGSAERGILVFSELRSRMGVVAVLGNHDTVDTELDCAPCFKRIGIPVLCNDRLFLGVDGFSAHPVEGYSLCIAGIGDLWTEEVSFKKALEGVPGGIPRLVLSHNPDTAELPMASHYRVDAMFSGHTHGGQVSLPLVGSPIVPSRHGQRYVGGICEGPHFPVIVSRGVGMTGLPLRVGVPPELVETTLLSYRA